MPRERKGIERSATHAEESELLHLILEVLLDIREAMPAYEPEQ